MSNVKTATEVTDVVQELIDGEFMFSAYDVTKIIRHRSANKNIQHRTIRAEVHQVYENNDMGIYDRTQVTVGAGAPFVYHESSDDPQSYSRIADWVDDYNRSCDKATLVPSLTTALSLNLDANTPVVPDAPKVDPIPVNTVGVNTLQSGYTTVKTTSESRLSIPTEMLKGFGNEAFVSQSIVSQNGANINALSVTSVRPQGEVINRYKINKDGRLRISEKTLKKVATNAQNYLVKNLVNSLGHEVIVVVPA